MAQNTLLELTTDAPERAAIKIDGVTYELKSREDLGLKEDAEYRKLMKDFSEAQPDQDWEKLGGLLNDMVLAVTIGLPAEVLAKLSDAKKLKIIEVFTKEITGARPAQAPQEKETAAV